MLLTYLLTRIKYEKDKCPLFCSVFGSSVPCPSHPPAIWRLVVIHFIVSIAGISWEKSFININGYEEEPPLNKNFKLHDSEIALISLTIRIEGIFLETRAIGNFRGRLACPHQQRTLHTCILLANEWSVECMVVFTHLPVIPFGYPSSDHMDIRAKWNGETASGFCILGGFCAHCIHWALIFWSWKEESGTQRLFCVYRFSPVGWAWVPVLYGAWRCFLLSFPLGSAISPASRGIFLVFPFRAQPGC